MKSPKFEIKIAILGHVSVGKTTLLNALLGKKFSEVSKKRTTAGINHFVVTFISRTEDPNKSDTCTDEEVLSNGSNKRKANSYEDVCGDNVMTAEETLKKITETNSRLRQRGAMKEDIMEVEIPGYPFIDMHENTKLVITDIPGVNEARTSSMYLDYVKDNWDGFDCVLVVMDADQGVNTEEQVNLLDFVKDNMDNKKNIPVVIVCNKVDDPDDEELMTLVGEVRDEVKRIFQAKGGIVDVSKETSGFAEKAKDDIPHFVSLSAEYAFLYRAVSGLGRDDIDSLGKEIINKIGQEETSKHKWKRMSKEKQCDLVYGVISDIDQYNERIATSNIDKLIQVLNHLVGGSKRQCDLIERQLTVKLGKLSVKDESFLDSLSSIYDHAHTLGKPTHHFRTKFWTMYEELKDHAFDAFEADPSKFQLVYAPMHALIKYNSGLSVKLSMSGRHDSEGINGEVSMDNKKTLESMKDVVVKYCQMIGKKMDGKKFKKNMGVDPWRYCYIGTNQFAWRKGDDYNTHVYSNNESNRPQAAEVDKYYSHFSWNESIGKWKSKYTDKSYPGEKNEHPFTDSQAEWESLNDLDWNNIMISVLIMKHHRFFYENFSKEMADLAYHFSKQFKSFDFDPMVSTFEVPAGPAEESHWGHLPWLFCNAMDKIEKQKSTKKRRIE